MVHFPENIFHKVKFLEDYSSVNSGEKSKIPLFYIENYLFRFWYTPIWHIS